MLGRPEISGLHLESGHVDDKVVLHVAFEHALVGIVALAW